MQFDAWIEHIISKSDIVKSYVTAFKVRPAPMTIEVAMAIWKASGAMDSSILFYTTDE